jgi:hypothetical protein
LHALAWWSSFTRHGGYRRFDPAENRQSGFPAGSRNQVSRQTRLVRGDGIEQDACGPEAPYGFIETLALEKHDGAGFHAAPRHLLERERAVPFRAFKPDIAWQRINDEPQPEALVEGSRGGNVDSGQVT